MEAAIVDRPDGFAVVPGTGGFRKARWARMGKGKSGGVRVIYFFAPWPDVLYMLDMYAKNQKENLTDAEKNHLKKLAASIKESLRAE